MDSSNGKIDWRGGVFAQDLGAKGGKLPSVLQEESVPDFGWKVGKFD